MKISSIYSAVVLVGFIFSSTIALSGPYSIPASGAHFTPHVAQPVLKTRPVTDRSVGHAQRSTPHMSLYTATTKNKSRRQGIVSAGGVRWNCKNRRCTTSASWGKPTVQMCKVLARTVGVIQSYGKHGAVLNATDMRSCNAGIMVAKSKRKPKTASNFNPNLAARAPVITSRTFERPPVRDGFSPPPGNRHVLSASPPAGGGFAPKRGVADTVRTSQLVLVGKGGNGGSAPDTVRTGQLVLVGKGGSGGPAPDTVRTGPLVLVGKPLVPDTIRTGQLALVGKLQAQTAPDTVRTGALVLVGKLQLQPVPDTVRTGSLVLVGKPQVPDTVRTGQLRLVGKKR